MVTHEIKSIGQLHAEYIEYTTHCDTVAFDWGRWLPTLGRDMRPMVPGELCFFLGDTGTGKTAVLQGIAKAARPLPVLFCELELPGTLCYERFAAMNTGIESRAIEGDYRQSDSADDYMRLEDYFEGLDHIRVCDSSRIDENSLTELIEETYPQNFGMRPAMVIVDYIGLMNSKGAKRYERIAQAAQELKRTAKATNTIMICASQVHRQGEDEATEIGLHSARNAGEIEESAGIVFGLMRDPSDKTLLKVKCLKSTKDGGGLMINCEFNGAKMMIRERAHESTHGQVLQETDTETWNG